MLVSVVSVCILTWIAVRIFLPLGVIFLHFLVIAKGNKSAKEIRKSGEWAIISGATSGIGLEYARALAALGRKVLILGRDLDKLKDITAALSKEWGVEVKYYQVDFQQTSVYEDLRKLLEPLDIGVLVNNVGMTQPYPCPFTEVNVEDSFISAMINCNIVSYVLLTRIVAPGMVDRRRGIIINISSASSLGPVPRSALYSSSKSYLSQFSLSLSYELRPYGILVQTVRPFFVQTKFIGKFRPPRLLTPTAAEFVDSAIKMVGVESVTFGTLSHSLQGLLFDLVPASVRITVADLLHAYRARQLRGH